MQEMQNARYNFDKATLCKLFISDLRIWVHLGCSAEEKHHPQLINLSIEFTFSSPPLGLVTDQLEDTICYLETVQHIQNLCQNKQFNLIEYLTSDVHRAIDEMLGAKRESLSLIKVRVHKMAPPVPGVHGGVHFTYCDKPKVQGDVL